MGSESHSVDVAKNVRRDWTNKPKILGLKTGKRNYTKTFTRRMKEVLKLNQL
jgi:hypothetical protein